MLATVCTKVLLGLHRTLLWWFCCCAAKGTLLLDVTSTRITHCVAAQDLARVISGIGGKGGQPQRPFLALRRGLPLRLRRRAKKAPSFALRQDVARSCPVVALKVAGGPRRSRHPCTSSWSRGEVLPKATQPPRSSTSPASEPIGTKTFRSNDSEQALEQQRLKPGRPV
eukprot:scaffold47752_cov66-Phaeocystis_antarctica.AAC.6